MKLYVEAGLYSYKAIILVWSETKSAWFFPPKTTGGTACKGENEGWDLQHLQLADSGMFLTILVTQHSSAPRSALFLTQYILKDYTINDSGGGGGGGGLACHELCHV